MYFSYSIIGKLQYNKNTANKNDKSTSINHPLPLLKKPPPLDTKKVEARIKNKPKNIKNINILWIVFIFLVSWLVSARPGKLSSSYKQKRRAMPTFLQQFQKTFKVIL
ncbi:hypothetical protein BJAS_P3006 [Bathymodiolus japonicus methanotrophic gill symbiont]|nr:hypothetical protein BJAS_P3006 [Bathymodiolus japonicus methanotrophic gill symbiont]